MAIGRGKDTRRVGHVYFIRCPSNGLIKIGFTADNLRNRLMRQMASSPVELVPLGRMAGTVRDERALHVRFKADWSHGEWFRPSEELATYIEAETESCPSTELRFVRQTVGKPPERRPYETIAMWAETATHTEGGITRTVVEWAKLSNVTPRDYKRIIETRESRRVLDEWDAGRHDAEFSKNLWSHEWYSFRP